MPSGESATPVDEARSAIQQNDWSTAFRLLSAADGLDGGLSPGDLELLAESSRFSGNPEQIVDPLERAHQRFVRDGDVESAARTALSLSLANADQCQLAAAASWWTRASELVTGLEEGPVLASYHWFASRRHGENGERAAQEDAAHRALEIASRTGDRNTEALALIELGHVATAAGESAAALDLMDRATALALAGEIGLFESGMVFCNAIFSSRSRGEWDRACEWTDSATRWVQRKRVAYFPGLCRVHRAEVLRVRGMLEAAEYESAEAARQLHATLPRWECYAQAELGEVRRRRGDHAGAMQAFRRALEIGWEPQPGMALLLFAQGDPLAAHQSLERFCGHPAPTLMCEDRSNLLAARVTVALAAGAVEVAQAALLALAAAGDADDSLPWDRAVHAQARGELALRAGAEDAIADLTEARHLWAELEAPYELATSRLLLARALLAQGDSVGAELESQLARGLFENLGARFDAMRAKTWLEGLPAGPRSAAPVRVDEASIRCEGDTWAVTFEGVTTRIRRSLGVEYLARLLGEPEVNHWAVDLVAGQAGVDSAPIDRDTGAEVLDEEARRAYRDRLRELQVELDEARELGRADRVEAAQSEMDTLTRHLAAAVGIGGRSRRMGGAAERARQSVTKALRGVVKRLAEEHAALGHYLEATIRTGIACRFEPDPRYPVCWTVHVRPGTA